MKLNDRLQKIAGQIREGETMADIGTDHGFLPIALKMSGRCPHVILTDISEGSLAKALSDCSLYDPEESYDLRAGDGLTVLRPGEVDNVVIAGMGGVLIGEILGKDPDLTYSFRRFILQPRNHIGKLRKALADLGIGIVREQIAEEGKFLCVILTAEPGAPCPSGPAYEDAPWLWDFPDSLIAEQDDLVRQYLKRESDKYKKIETQILEHSEDAARLEGIRQYLKRISILIKEME